MSNNTTNTEIGKETLYFGYTDAGKCYQLSDPDGGWVMGFGSAKGFSLTKGTTKLEIDDNCKLTLMDSSGVVPNGVIDPGHANSFVAGVYEVVVSSDETENKVEHLPDGKFSPWKSTPIVILLIIIVVLVLSIVIGGVYLMKKKKGKKTPLVTPVGPGTGQV